MALSPRESFKVGFLGRCAEAGMTPDQMLGVIKQAQDKLAFVSGLLGGLKDVASGVGGAVTGYGIPLALAAPPVLGGIAGYGLGRLSDIDDTDIDDIKDQEVLDEYKRQTARLLREQKVRDYQKTKKQTGRIFL